MKILTFVEEMKEKATQGLLEVSGTGKLVEKTYTFKGGHADIVMIRDGAIEKAAISHLVLKGITPPGANEEIDAMVYQMEVFPENPYCPMGHFNTEWLMKGPGPYYMNLDLFPAVRIEEDLRSVEEVMNKVADRFGRERDKMREGLDIHYTMEHFAVPLAAKVGCKLLELKEEDVDLFISAYQAFFDAYLDILRKRKGSPYSETDRQLKLERNGKWLEYITLKDRAVKMAQAVGVPPEVLIALSYPPSAVF
jgi:coproporphyrinogen III oxidase